MDTPHKQLLKSLLTMGAVVEARDAYTGGHLWRVSQFSKILGLRMGLNAHEAIYVALGGFLHDLGKVGVQDSILNKPGPLTVEEYDVIKTHPVIGADLIEEHPLSHLAYDVIRHHHERLDGAGYPDALEESQLSLNTRIVSIADAFDAMTSTRPYRQGMAIDQALSILKKERGSQFDSTLVDHFLDLNTQGILEHIVQHSDEQIPMLNCPSCGPVIVISRYSQDGDTVYCKLCRGGMRLHRDQDSFDLEPIKAIKITAESLKPTADFGPIDDLVKQAPDVLMTI